jgi:hypothetical protein
VRASPTRWLQSENDTTKKKFVLPFFPPNEMPALFPVQRNNADDFSIRRPCATLQNMMATASGSHQALRTPENLHSVHPREWFRQKQEQGV